MIMIIKREVKYEKNTYSKDSILKSKKYKSKNDLLKALLKDDKNYSFEEVDAIINKFMKGKVN